MGFFATLWESPAPTPSSRYTEWNGLFYLGCGLGGFVWPGAMQVFFGADQFAAHEEGLVRAVALMLALIGWLYVMGGRTRASSFVLATVVDRLLVPAFLLPLAVFRVVDPHVVVPFAILDPLLALGALVIFKRTSKTPE